MFTEDIFHTILQSSVPNPLITSNDHIKSTSSRVNSSERSSHGRSRDIFTEFSQAVDHVFEAAARSFFRDPSMLPRSYYSNHLRDYSYGPPSYGRRVSGVTLNGDVVERMGANADQRNFRHTNHDPVHMERTRLQWYDSNTRRALLPPPPPNHPEPSGRLTVAELAKLPVSTYHIKPGAVQSDESNSNSSPVPVVLSRNENDFDCSPGSAYLQPLSRSQGLVLIQPLQSSPSRGQPECEVCLTEYRNEDQLRHLPCGHAFHTKCIDVWFRQSSTCPKCRAGVRTGLKRLERNRLRARSSGPTVSEAPIRAIRQRATGTGTNQQASSESVNTSATHRSSVRSPQLVTSRTDAPHTGSSSDSFQSPAVPGLPRMVNQNSPIYSGPIEARRTRSINRSTEMANQDRSNRSTGNIRTQSTNRVTRVTPRVNSGASRASVIHTSTPLNDKSAFARRMAAEAAIRRANSVHQQPIGVTESTRENDTR